MSVLSLSGQCRGLDAAADARVPAVEELDIELRRVGSGKRMTFAEGEAVLSQWMADNAFVCWQQDDAPWVRERELIEELSLPLNLDGNKSNPFAATVSGLRRSAREVARQLPVVPNK